MASERSEYDGLSIDDIVPIAWEDADFTHAATFEHANEETSRAL